MLLVYFLIKSMVFCSEMNTGGRGEAVVRASDSHQFGLCPVITENPKGEIAENFGRIQGGITQICLENDKGQDKTDKRCRGDRESHQKLLGGITSVK